MDMAAVFLVGTVGSDATAIGSDSTRGAKFRMVANRRRFDRPTESWVTASEYWVEVVCWGRLGEGVAGGIRRGDPVLVTGYLESSSWTVDGITHYRDRVVASAVGHDLSRGAGTFERHGRQGAATDDGSESPVNGSIDVVPAPV